MRPSTALFLIFIVITALDSWLFYSITKKRDQWHKQVSQMQNSFRTLGLTDPAISTEARYTRHPAVSDKVVPFMDHPGGVEHFPSGSFFSTVQ